MLKNNLNRLIAVIIFLFFMSAGTSLFSEKIYFYQKTSFKNAQFWEKQINEQYSKDTWKVFSNFFGGSVGLGMEMVIWDSGVKRGSRLFFKGGIDLDFFGLQFIGGYKDKFSESFSYYDDYRKDDNKYNDYTMYGFGANDGVFYMGFNWDLFLGGTFPKTNLIWGFGCSWNFLFPLYSPSYNVSSWYARDKDGGVRDERWAFFAVPSIILAYDFFIPDSNIKITPQLRAGLTCNPLIPFDLVNDDENKFTRYVTSEMYSGLYVELSAAVSFIAIEWKK